MTKFLKLFARITLFAGGAGAMYAEGQAQSHPGIGFAVAMVLIFLALCPWRRA